MLRNDLKYRSVFALSLMMMLILSACVMPAPAPADAPAAEATEAPAEEAAAEGEGEEMMGEADLAAVKTYAIGNAENMKAGSAELLEIAQRYYDLASENDFDYAAALGANAEEIPGLVAAAQAAWLKTSEAYELDEGIVAGVPSLAYYDVLIDAGASAEEDPEEALEWTLTLPDGTELVSPGNYFHSLLEPLLWQTNADYVVDVDGMLLPDANLFLGTAEGLDAATQEMLDAVNAWEPTLSDAFTALVVMIPTMNEYFEQWKLSSFVSGESSEEAAFVGHSRLFDVVNILNGLDVTYQNVSVLVEGADADQDAQIASGFEDLMGYVGDLYGQEQGGTAFSPEEADLFGTEAQDKATALAGQVSQAAALLEIEVQE
ncbi:MAG: EfeM/EfeO family lipoprotein [Chloroflexota bacterium]